NELTHECLLTIARALFPSHDIAIRFTCTATNNDQDRVRGAIVSQRSEWRKKQWLCLRHGENDHRNRRWDDDVDHNNPAILERACEVVEVPCANVPSPCADISLCRRPVLSL